MKKLLFLFVLLVGNIASAQEAVVPIEAPLQAQPAGNLSCFDYYHFGSVQADLQTNLSQTVPGVPLAFTGQITNDNDYPLVDGTLSVKIFRRDENTFNQGDGNPVVDQFTILENVNLPAKGSKEASFEWTVPNNAQGGEYYAAYFFTTSKRYNLMGLSFTDDVVGNQAGFTVTNDASPQAVTLQKTTTTVNGQDHRFAAFPLHFSKDEAVTIKTTLKNPENKEKTVPLQWNQYTWDAQNEDNRTNTKTELVTLAPNEEKEVSYEVKPQRGAVVYVVAVTQDGQSKSFLNIRYVKDGVEETRINFPSLKQFPLKADTPNVLFVCAHSTNEPQVPGNTLLLTLKDQNDNTLYQYRYEGDISGAMGGFGEDFKTDKDYDYATLTAQLFRNGEEVENVQITYDCNQIDPSTCSDSKEASMTSSTFSDNLIFFGGGIIVLILLIVAFLYLKRTPKSLTFLFALMLGVGVFGGGGVEAAGTASCSPISPTTPGVVQGGTLLTSTAFPLNSVSQCAAFCEQKTVEYGENITCEYYDQGVSGGTNWAVGWGTCSVYAGTPPTGPNNNSYACGSGPGVVGCGGSLNAGYSVCTYVPDTVVVPNVNPANLTVTGPTTGTTGQSYTFTLSATDPDGDTLRYGIDWNNDGTVDQWAPGAGYVASGTSQSVGHAWSTPGTYTFQVLAQDSNGGNSGWVTHTIVISDPNTGGGACVVGPLTHDTYDMPYSSSDPCEQGLVSSGTPQCQAGLTEGGMSLVGPCFVSAAGRQVHANGDEGWACEADLYSCATSSAPTPTINFSINSDPTGPVTVPQGGDLRIVWDATNVTSCQIWGAGFTPGQTIATSGNVTIPATVSDTYIITCTGPNGSTTSSIPVVIADTLKVCQGSCSSGIQRTNFTMSTGGTQNLVACYNSAVGCNDPSGNVTDTATWTENTGSGVITLSGTNPRVVTAGTPGTEGFSATYNGQTVNLSATVTCIPTVSCTTAPEAANFCQNETFTTNNGCGTTITCNGTKSCEYNWKEVAP